MKHLLIILLLVLVYCEKPIIKSCDLGKPEYIKNWNIRFEPPEPRKGQDLEIYVTFDLERRLDEGSKFAVQVFVLGVNITDVVYLNICQPSEEIFCPIEPRKGYEFRFAINIRKTLSSDTYNAIGRIYNHEKLQLLCLNGTYTLQ
jgi:hypothetical protein